MAKKRVDHQRLKTLWGQNLSIRQIARDLDCAEGYVSVMAVRFNLPPRSYKKIDDAVFRQMWTDGVPMADICKHFTCSNYAVRDARIRCNLPKRQGSRPRKPKPKAVQKPVPKLPVARKPNARRVALPRNMTTEAHAPEPRADNPSWPARLDAALIATRGKYQALAAFAEKHGRPISAVTARWHQVRP